MFNFENILYPIDLDSKNFYSLEKALEFAQTFDCLIHILYVNDTQAGYRHPMDHEDAVALMVRDNVPESLLENTQIFYAISKGDPAEEIIKYAKKNQIDLIIIGHKHHSKLYTSLFDSTDVNVIDSSLLPVLVIPDK